MDDLIFTVAVGFNTHDGLQTGQPDGLQFAAVLAADDIDAQLVAAQLVACRGVMPTSTAVCSIIA